MSLVYNISVQFERNIVDNRVASPNGGRDKALIEMVLKSLPVLKCNVGNYYHMEGMAKLTLIDNMSRGVTFMLISF